MPKPELAMCVTCGKMGGACRWTDDPVPCMKQQLIEMRAEVERLEYVVRGDGWDGRAS